jgi:hypothetical protein
MRIRKKGPGISGMKHIGEICTVRLSESQRDTYEGMFERHKQIWCDTTYEVLESVAFTVNDSMLRIGNTGQFDILAGNLWYEMLG